MTARSLRVLLSGMIAGDPWRGGATWAVLQYWLGLRRLGHDVLLVEPVTEKQVVPPGAPLATSANAHYFHRVCAAFGLEGHAALLLAGGRETVGPPYERLREEAGRADVLLNIAGMLTDDQLIRSAPIRAYLDLDPAFTQLWHAVQGIDMRFAGHTHFLTIGLGIGRPGCDVPTCERQWLHTLQPIVLEHWPMADRLVWDALTTVASWRSYGSVHHGGRFYGQKAHSLRPLFALPTLSPKPLVLALDIHPHETNDLRELRENGWELLDPVEVAGGPEQIRAFIQGSWAELGLAKQGYVVSRCGWFSDRSICYLASGRPVLAQATGLSDFLPTGEGLLAFETITDVLAGIDSLQTDYARHARTARALAVEYFDSDRVLRQLLDHIGALG
jgi:hypothetical protein